MAVAHRLCYRHTVLDRLTHTFEPLEGVVWPFSPIRKRAPTRLTACTTPSQNRPPHNPDRCPNHRDTLHHLSQVSARSQIPQISRRPSDKWQHAYTHTKSSTRS